MSLPSICAIICVRNEMAYLPSLIDFLARQDVDIVLIDNSSDDGSLEFAQDHVGKEIYSLEQLPYRGEFSLEAQLQKKWEVANKIHHDWILHQDADERLEANDQSMTLRALAELAEAKNCNTVNFNEFVFLPEKDQDVSKNADFLNLRRYYFFEPQKHRLMRLWRRCDHLDNRTSGGHKLSGELRVLPQSHILRHYITLGQNHLEKKYLNRIFGSNDRKKGWHGTRVGLTRTELSLDKIDGNYLSVLPSRDSRNFDRSKPYKTHFWQWS